MSNIQTGAERMPHVFFSSRRRHTRFDCDWSSDVCSSDLVDAELVAAQLRERAQDAHQQATRSGLRLDQAAAVWHVLTSARTVEVGTGPAGAGKNWGLGPPGRAGGGPGVGTAPPHDAPNEPRPARGR